MTDNGEFNVKHNKKEYNIHAFLHSHPGGVNYLAPYKEKDVSKRMEDTKHSKAAFYLLQEYQNGAKRTTDEDTEDLEKLVNWDKPMLSQVGSLGTRYKDWVLSPVDRELRLFGNPILENLTITPWYVVPLIWLPVITYLIKFGSERYIDLTQRSSPTGYIFLHIALGVVLWSFLEYSLHRWVFHMEPSGNWKLMIYFHFAIHGLHHKVPFDTTRLVFPPFPAAVIATILYNIFCIFVSESVSILILAGALLGYLTYDMIHFYLHYGAPKETSYFYELKRHHNQHHFAHHDSGFGISSVAWDKIFGTAIKLRKLNKSIIW